MANQYPIEDFQKIYDAIYASMGDDATLQANIEAALKPLYEQSKQQLEAERIARNADIDVDAYSRGMGNSTWVTDAKLRQLKNEQQNLATLNANYNNQLYSALMNAMQNRDNNAFSQAMQMYQLNHSGGGGSGSSSKAPSISENPLTYEQYLSVIGLGDQLMNKFKGNGGAVGNSIKNAVQNAAQMASTSPLDWNRNNAASPLDWNRNNAVADLSRQTAAR